MATYASPKILKWTLLVIDTIIFFMTLCLLMYTLIDYIGFENDWHPYHDRNQFECRNSAEQLSPDGVGNTADDDDKKLPLCSVNQFPSIGSNTVRTIVPIITMAVAIVGIIAANDEKCRLLNINGYLCFLSFFVKYLFIFVSLRMAGLSSPWTSLGTVIFPLYLTIGLVELILAMSSCQLSSILKRGGSVTPRIQKLEIT